MSSLDLSTRSASPYSVPPYRSLLPLHHSRAYDHAGNLAEITPANIASTLKHTPLNSDALHLGCCHAVYAKAAELMNNIWQTPGTNDGLQKIWSDEAGLNRWTSKSGEDA